MAPPTEGKTTPPPAGTQGRLQGILVLAAALVATFGLARLGLVLTFQAVAVRTTDAGLFLFGVTALAFLRVATVAHRHYLERRPVPVLAGLPNATLAAVAAGFFAHAVALYAADPQTYVLFWGFFLIDAGFKLALATYFGAAFLLARRAGIDGSSDGDLASDLPASFARRP